MSSLTHDDVRKMIEDAMESFRRQHNVVGIVDKAASKIKTAICEGNESIVQAIDRIDPPETDLKPLCKELKEIGEDTVQLWGIKSALEELVSVLKKKKKRSRDDSDE